MNNKVNLMIRLISYFAGLLTITIGIAISVKSDLGVSPVSSIPYTMTCVWGIEMGLATIFFHTALVVLQLLILRKDFQLKSILQVPVGILFGYFTTFSNSLMVYFPDPANFTVQMVLMLISTVFIAIGLFFYVPADIIPLAAEGMMLAISEIGKFKFSTSKIIFDVSVVVISLVICLAIIHQLGSVGIGTVVASVIVGLEIKVITKFFGKWRDKLLAVEKIKFIKL